MAEAEVEAVAVAEAEGTPEQAEFFRALHPHLSKDTKIIVHGDSLIAEIAKSMETL